MGAGKKTAINHSDSSEQCARRDRDAKKAAIAGMIGNMLEWYDFVVYAYLASTIGKHFFAAAEGSIPLLLAFAVFGAGFVMRPLGAVVFGVYCDKYGRRAALTTVTIIMTISTLAIGVMPTYSEIGVFAPIGLVAARLLQGLSCGGEAGSSMAYLVEFATADRRGFVGSWQQFSVGAGFLLGSMAATLLTQTMNPADFEAWGWRIPFLVGIVLAAVGAFIRLQIPDTPSFQRIAAAEQTSHAPLAESFGANMNGMLRAFGFALLMAVAYYVVLGYMATYLKTVAHLDTNAALQISTLGLVVFVAFTPIAGALSDRIGRKPVLLGACVAFFALSWPMFRLAATGGFTGAAIATCLLALFLSVYAGPCPAAYCELFPTRVRATALSVGYNIAIAIFGGFAPFAMTWLISSTGIGTVPAIYLMIAAAISGLVIVRSKETAFHPMD